MHVNKVIHLKKKQNKKGDPPQKKTSKNKLKIQRKRKEKKDTKHHPPTNKTSIQTQKAEYSREYIKNFW